jgi:hypothetical protein
VAAVTSGTRQVVGLALIGLALVAGARWALPQAPPIYEGITVPPPYQYCHPPANLRSSNKLPTGGEGDLQVVGGVNKLGTVETQDRQVVVFFAQGVFKLNAPLHVTVGPVCDSPTPPPAHSTLVGNVYRVQVRPSTASASTPPLQIPAQVLLRVPPVPYNTVRVYYAGAWHDTQFGAQIDLVNVSLATLGEVAAFNDTSLKQPAKPPPSVSYAAIISGVLVLVAVALIGAGIIAQRRRERDDKPT